MDVGYYAPAARTTLNLAVFIVFLGEIDLRLANPRVHTLWARAGAFRHPAVVCSTTTTSNEKTQKYKVVDLVESYNFRIKIIYIQVRMKKI